MKHTKTAYVFCDDGICEGSNALADYKIDQQAMKAQLIQSLMYVDQFRSLLNPLGKAYQHVSKFLEDDDLNEMIGVKEMLETQKNIIAKEQGNDLPSSIPDISGT